MNLRNKDHADYSDLASNIYQPKPTFHNDKASQFDPNEFSVAPKTKRDIMFHSQENKKKVNYLNEVLQKKLGGEERTDFIGGNSDDVSNNFTSIDTSLTSNHFINSLFHDDESEIILDDRKTKNLSSLINDLNKKKKVQKNPGNTNKFRLQAKSNLKPQFNNKPPVQIEAPTKIAFLRDDKSRDDANTVKSSNVKIPLDFADIKGIKIQANKTNSGVNVNDSISVGLGNFRFNFSPNSLNHFLKVFKSYELIIKKLISKISSDVNILDENKPNKIKMLYIKESFELKTLILEKTNSLLKKLKNCNVGAISQNNNAQINENDDNNNYNNEPYDMDVGFIVESMKEYSSYLDNEIKSMDKILLEEGNNEVNYLFNIFHKNKIDVSFNIQNIIMVAYNLVNQASSILGNNNAQSKSKGILGNSFVSNPNTKEGVPKVLGKLLIPNYNMKLKITHQKVCLSAFESDIEFYDLEQWRKIFIYLIEFITSKIDYLKYYTVQPFIKEYFKEMNIDEENMRQDILNQIEMNKNETIENQNEDIELYNIHNKKDISDNEIEDEEIIDDKEQQIQMNSNNHFQNQNEIITEGDTQVAASNKNEMNLNMKKKIAKTSIHEDKKDENSKNLFPKI